MANRKTTYRLCPSATQERALLDMLGLHQRLYNAALEQRIIAYRNGIRMGFSKQCKDLTDLRAEGEYASLNAQSSQVTLKRLDLAYQSFFRRVKSGDRAGFPRFKSFDRFAGWGYKTHGDGWRLLAGPEMKHGFIRLSGVGRVSMRGGTRTVGEPKTCEIQHKQGRWYASVTLDCEPQRETGRTAIGFDWGTETFATIAHTDGTYEPVANPRFTRNAMAELKAAQLVLDRKKHKGKNRKKAAREIGRIYSRTANQRLDFIHQTSALFVKLYCLIATEKLAVKRMTKKFSKMTDEEKAKLKMSAAGKRGLNREILSTAPAMFLRMLSYKAEEARGEYTEIATRIHKPSQTCCICGRQKKKDLGERMHICPCGAHMSRDENSARVILNIALFGSATGQELHRLGIRPQESLAIACTQA
jgi:putative transposase